jgi:metal-dependent amidase/aminoacylase/carboxypeptidase family protein
LAFKRLSPNHAILLRIDVDDYTKAVDMVKSMIVEWRQALHRIPECDFNEHQTAAYVAGVLGELRPAVHTGIGGMGLSRVLETACAACGLAR